MTKLISLLIELGKMLLMLTPFLILALLNAKVNLKRRIRYKQFSMPIFGVLFCLLAMVLLGTVYEWSIALLQKLPGWIAGFADWLLTLPKWIHFLGHGIGKLALWLTKLFKAMNLEFWAFYLANFLLMLGYLIVKKLLLVIMKASFKEEGSLFLLITGMFYERDEELGEWYLKKNWGQARTFAKSFYVLTVVLGAIAVLGSSKLYKNGMLSAPFYPVFGVIIMGEIWFFLNGLTRKELRHEITGQDDEADTVCDYSVMRQILRKLFPDRLAAENTTVSDPAAPSGSTEELLDRLEASDDPAEEAYGVFMRRKKEAGMELDRNYLLSGRQLLFGESVLFNNPFYYDLIPYAFYPMNRTILRHKKVLIVLGRHGTEQAIANWCREGLQAVTNVPEMWNVGILSEDSRDLDVGIVTRSSVHDLKLHETNRDFFDETEFVMILEPSRLVTTAQIGMNSLIRHCRRKEKQLVFCSADKNCDGLVDALSHILMTSIREVTATNHHQGASSYMIWEADNERLQHRMLPNLSRYLGMGTELSFAALKNQVGQTRWFGGESFPVVDIHWIVKQYYYDLLNYAGLPAEQEVIDKQFLVSADMWSAKACQNQYMTVEDESFNMFEVKRDFSTRATDQGFVNVITSEYLLKDYMADNDSIFNADPKAIPYITADYARTPRNVVLRLCLRMSTGMVPESDIVRELTLLDLQTKEPIVTLWNEVCATCGHIGSLDADADGRSLLCCDTSEGPVRFSHEVIIPQRRFNVDTGKMETMYRITDGRFIKLVLGGLHCVEYIAEDENGQRQYIGTELHGQVFQKFLPGQFFTFGGKYYEMLRVTYDGQLLVRRAADHIDGRPFYRQIRNYYLRSAVDSTLMGHCKDLGNMRITRQYADLRVSTPAYWAMERYNDFSTARRTGINGVPDRVYNNKSILRIDLTPDTPVAPETLRTLTLLINETLRTLLAENQDYLVALTPGQVCEPMTYSLEGENGFVPEGNSIYIVEDSQLDIGLLDAVERNIHRILAIVCDYLQWHTQKLNVAAEPEKVSEPVEYAVEPEEEQPQQAQPKTWIGRVLRKIGNFFKGIWKRICGFFAWLFRRNKKKPQEQTPEVETPETETPQTETPQTADGVTEPANQPQTQTGAVAEEPATQQSAPVEEAGEDAPKKKKKGFFGRLFGRKKKDEQTAGDADGQESQQEAEQPAAQAEPGSESVTAEAEEEVPVQSEEETTGEDPSEDVQMLFSAAPGSLGDTLPDDGDDSESAAVESGAGSDGDTVDFEPEKTFKPVEEAVAVRKDYSQRHYLRYGDPERFGWLDVAGVSQLLLTLGYGNSALEQARKGRDVAAMVERTFVPNRSGTQYCDFCGCELVGLEYEVLADGRERCNSCGRTAVKTLDEFVAIHDAVLRNMKLFFGVKINAPVHVQMVNSKKLHKKLGKTFVPTGSYDGRVLGVAIRDKNGYSILVENGAPKLSSIMTMVHEMTHIWQYLNWDGDQIVRTYGKELELEVYEGMAKWVELQYTYLLGETAAAKREEIITRMRQDEYGQGFLKYEARYPLTIGPLTGKGTPFDNKKKPL